MRSLAYNELCHSLSRGIFLPAKLAAQAAGKPGVAALLLLRYISAASRQYLIAPPIIMKSALCGVERHEDKRGCHRICAGPQKERQ